MRKPKRITKQSPHANARILRPREISGDQIVQKPASNKAFSYYGKLPQLHQLCDEDKINQYKSEVFYSRARFSSEAIDQLSPTFKSRFKIKKKYNYGVDARARRKAYQEQRSKTKSLLDCMVVDVK